MAQLYFKIKSDWQEVVKLREEIARLKVELKSIDVNKAPAAAKTLEKQIDQSTRKMRGLVEAAAHAGVEMGNNFKKKIFDASQSVNGFTEKIIAQKAVVKDVEMDVHRLGEAYRKALKNNPVSASGKLAEYTAAKKALDEEKVALFDLTQQQAEARLSVKRLRDEYSLLKGDEENLTQKTEGLGVSLTKAFAVLGGAAMVKSFLSNMVSVRGEFQQIETSMQTILGSKEKADALMAKVKEYAKISPLDLKSVSSATQMMLGFNIEAEKVPRYLQAIGDVSMGDTGRFNSLTLAFSQMSATGRLLGQDLNQMINAGFNPLSVMAEKSGKSIAQLKEEMSKGAISAEMVQQAFIDATSAEGRFYNMSENASKTINGQLSMLQDAMDNVFNELGEKGEGVVLKGIHLTTSLIQNYETVGKVLAGLVSTYGAYRAAVMLASIETGRHTLAEIALTNVRIMARKAQIALNSSMLANPYVLLATAVVGLGTAMWALSGKTDSAKRGMDAYNESVRKAAEEEAKHKQEMEKLLSVAGDERASTDDRREALRKLEDKYPDIFAKYKTEAEMLQNILEINRAISKEYKKRSNQREVDELDSLNSEIKKIENAIKEASKSGAGQAIPALVKKRDELVTHRNLREREISKKRRNEILSNLTGYSNEELDKEISVRDRLIRKIENSIKLGHKVSGGNLKDGILPGQKSIDELKSEKQALERERNAREKGTSYKQDLERAKKDWETAKKELSAIERDKEKFTSKQYEDAKKRAETAEKAYKDLGGVVLVSANQESQAEKLRKENEKYNLLLDKQKLEQLRKSQDIENQLEQAEIDKLVDGTEKTIRQRELNNKLEIQAIERQKEDYVKAIIQAEKEKFDAEEDIKASKDKNYKKKTFDASSVSVDASRFDTIISNTKFAQERKFGDELLKQYQSYTDERLSIEKKFNDDIILLQEARKKAAANGNTDEISKIDRSIAKATADKGKALMKHDFGILKQSPEYIRAFEDLRNTSSETLSSLLEQLESAKETAASVLNPEDLREYTTTIQDIMDELEGRNPFQSLADRQRELAEAERELAEAKRQLDAVMNGAKIVTGIKSTKLGADGLINIENTYLSAEDALKKYNKAKDKAYKSNNNFIKAEKRAKKSVDELANAIKSIGDSIGGQSGEIISLIGDVSLFASKSIDGITMVAKTGAEAIKTGAEAMSAVEKASVILGIVSAGIQLLQKLNSLLPTAESRYEEFAAKVAEINKLTEAVNEYRIAAIEARHAEEGWFSENGLKGLRNYREVHDEVFKAYKDKVNEQQAVYQNKKGGGWLTGSLGYGLLGGIDAIFGTNILGNKYDKNTIEAIKNLRIETRGRSRGLFGSGIFGHSQETEDLISWARNNGFGELFGKDNLINKDAAKAIIDKYGDKLVGQTKETLEALVKLREKYDEYIEKLHEYVNSLYEPLVDKFVDSIWTWLSDGKDALKSFREYAGDTFKDIANDMLKSIVLSKIFGKGENSYQSKINKAYEDYAKKLIDEVELNRRVSELTKELMGTAEQQLPVIQGMAKNINDTMKNIAGIDLVNGSFSQESTRKGFETMTQDQAGELNGRFTALQVSGEEMKLQSIAQSQSLNILTMKAEDILSVSTDTRNIADDIRSTIADSYLELVQISENTGAIIKPIQQMQKDIAEVKKNTSKL